MTDRTVCRPTVPEVGIAIRSGRGVTPRAFRVPGRRRSPSESSLTAGTRLGILLALARGEC